MAGQDVRTDPQGSFDLADVTIADLAPVEIVITAHNIPTGTVPKLHLLSLEGNDQEIAAPALAGTLEESTSTIPKDAGVKFPSGFTRGYVRATWTATQ